MGAKQDILAFWIALGLAALIAGEPARGAPRPEIWSAMDQEVGTTGDNDDALLEKVYCSKELEKYLTLAMKGKWVEADTEWAKILKTLAPCRSIFPLVKLVYQRV